MRKAEKDVAWLRGGGEGLRQQRRRREPEREVEANEIEHQRNRSSDRSRRDDEPEIRGPVESATKPPPAQQVDHRDGTEHLADGIRQHGYPLVVDDAAPDGDRAKKHGGCESNTTEQQPDDRNAVRYPWKCQARQPGHARGFDVLQDQQTSFGSRDVGEKEQQTLKPGPRRGVGAEAMGRWDGGDLRNRRSFQGADPGLPVDDRLRGIEALRTLEPHAGTSGDPGLRVETRSRSGRPDGDR